MSNPVARKRLKSVSSPADFCTTHVYISAVILGTQYAASTSKVKTHDTNGSSLILFYRPVQLVNLFLRAEVWKTDFLQVPKVRLKATEQVEDCVFSACRMPSKICRYC